VIVQLDVCFTEGRVVVVMPGRRKEGRKQLEITWNKEKNEKGFAHTSKC